MRYGSVCSGIEAASVAWHPLGWTPVFYAEIEPFPSAILAARWPGVPNLGDFTRIGRDVACDPIDLLVGGTPCQSFSVAGLRGGLGDERGNLALEFLRLADRLRPRWVVWENVPGVLSSLSHDAPDPCPPPPPVDVERDGAEMETEDDYGAEELHAFGCFVAGLSELGYGWSFWVPDAQYFGLAQRRRRVFVVGHLGAWPAAAAVLLEPSCLSGNPPPSRTKGQGVAAGLTRGADSSGKGGYAGRRREDDVNLVSGTLRGEAFDRSHDDGTQLVANPIGAKRDGGWRGDLDNDTYVPEAFGGNNTSGPVDVATAVNAHGGAHGRQDFESETFVAEPQAFALQSFHSIAMSGDGDAAAAREVDVARCLDRTGGFESNQGGTLVAAHEVAFAIQERAVSENPDSGPDGIGVRDDGAAYTLEAREKPQAVAFGWAKSAAQTLTTDAETTDALQASPTSNPAVATFDERNITSPGNRSSVEPGAPCHSLHEVPPGLIQEMAVRRLTPRECERLQGFPDDYTLIPWNGHPIEECPDGPRYRVLGNSFPVPVIRWIGRRIATVDAILRMEKRG